MRRPSREDLTRRALAILEDAIHRFGAAGPLTGDEPGLRLALAFLFAIASREVDYPQPDGEPFVQLWTTITGRPNQACDGKPEFRSSWAGTQFAVICRRVGAIEGDLRLSPRQERMNTEARRHFADLVRQAGKDVMAENDAKRMANTCYIDRPGRKR